MDTTSATSTPLSIKNILESVADAKEKLIKRLQGIEDNLNKKYDKKIDALQSDYTRNTTAEEEKYQKDKQKLIEEHPDDKSRLEELEKKHTDTLNSLQEKLKKEVHNVKSEAIEEIIGVISGTDSRLSKDDLTFSDLDYVLNQIKAELTINSAVKFLNEWHGNIQTLSKQLGGDTGFATKKYSELKTLLAKSEESAKKTSEGIANVGESMDNAKAQFEEAFSSIVQDFADKISEEEKTDKDLLTAIAIAHGGAEKSLEDLKKRYSTLNGIQDRTIEDNLKNSIVGLLKTKHEKLKDNKEALDNIANAYIRHAQGRKELANAVGNVESNREKFRKGVNKFISKDTAGGRLLKMFIAGAKAGKGKRLSGMLGSIKQDIRKDYDSFFYKDAEGLGGIARMFIGSILESGLSTNRQARAAEKNLKKYDAGGEETIRQMIAAASSPSVPGTGGNSTAANATTGKVSGYASGKRNIEDGVHVVGEKGAELLVKQGNSVSILQIKPDVSAPASIGVSPSGASEKPSMESSAEYERKQQETEDRHSIAKHTETIVELLREGNEIAKKKETEKKGGGSLLDSLFGLLGMFKPLLKNLLKGLGKLGKFGASLLKKAGSLLGRGARGLGGALKTGGRMGLNALKGAGGIAKGILGKLGPAAMIGMGLYDAYQGWNDEDLHRRAFGLKEGEKASTGQKIQAGMASAGAGILNIGSDIASFFGMDSLAEKIRIDPATLAQAYQTPLKSFGKMITGLTDGVPILGDAVKGLGDFIDSSPMLKGAVDWLDDHNPTKLLTEGIGSAVDWISSDHKWEDVKKGCGNILGTISGGMSDLWKGITGNFSKTNDWLKKKSDVVFNFIKEYNPLALILKGYEKIKGFVMEKYQKITSWWEENNPFNPIINFFTSIGEFFKSLKLSSMLENVLDIPGRDYLLGWLRDKGLASGAYVRSSARGTLAVIGEGKEDEAVMPISKLARFALESFDLLEGRMSGFANADTHHGDRNADMLAKMRRSLRGEKRLDIPSILISIDETAKDMQKNLDSIYKMMRYIKVDGITLGDMLDHKPSDMRGAQISPGAGYTGAQIGAAVNQMPGGGQSWGAAPALGGPMQALDLPASGAFSGGKAENLNASKQQIANLVIAEAKRQGVDPRLALAIARQESNFNQNDISRAGAVGVMQIMPADVNDYGGGNVYNLNDNIRIGVTEIKKKLQLANGDVREALLRYNWGDGNVRSYKRRGTGNRGQQIPKEAREYADRVLGHIQRGTVANIMKASPGGEAAAMQGAQTINPAPSPSTPPSAGIPPAPVSGGGNGGNINPGNAKDALTPESLNKLSGVHPELRKRFLAAAAEFYSRYHQKLSVVSGKRSEGKQAELKAKLGGNAAGGSKPLPDGSISYAPHVCGLALDVHGIGKNKQSTIDLLANSGILEKYGLWRPLVNGNGSCKPEYWHIEPKGSRDPGAYGLVSGIITNRTAARFGITDKLGNGNFSDSSGDIQAVPQDKPETFDIPGMNGGPVPEAPSPSPTQTAIPNVRFGSGGMSPTPPPGGTLQPMQQAHTPGMGLGGQSGTPQYGGGNLASRLLGIARKNAEISGVHGYSKGNREGTNQFDCSSFVGRSLQEAGYNVGPISNFNTGTMGGILKNLGFQWHDGLNGVQPGDIVWGNGHTEIAIGGGKSIGALNPTKGVGIHPLSWHRYTGYWRDGAISQMSPEEAAVVGQTPSIQGGPNPAIPGQGGNVRDAMGGVQVPDMGQAAGPSAGPQIQGSPQAQAQQAAQVYYESGGGGNVYAPTTNVMGGGGNADKGGATFLTTKDPMSWIILQGNTVH